ncbi:hypothetical protein [Pseudomonas panipatensis]|uniref:Uncharacterized protein n=1 Tax=Pseudomonas panipatensis TaxID=428992 RepID=A0A1G8LGF8_9PSED|nr:hypothetical protein [Pseudomonas panipatensis]SDI54771.1 hypothetical protein SAMN05216272_111140 [Pseudomonas panipatensis]SMP74947.1 hypothetical protein SAMN06295951_11360 [Pseudomonas panipatensis]
MITSKEADALADHLLGQYFRACGCATPEDVRKAGEMVISKTARGIEKYCGTARAVDVLQRTWLHIEPEATPS